MGGRLLPVLGRAGLQGLEVYRPRHRRSEVLRYESICKASGGLLMSGGSDWHTPDSGTSLGDFHVTADEIEAESRAPPPRVQGNTRELQSRGLPKRVLYLLLADTLATDQPFELSFSGVTNINGVPDGGGTAEVLREAPQLREASPLNE